MSKPIEFGDFYRLLNSVKLGEKGKKAELDWLLAEYEHAKECEGAFDELGQIFCHIGIMELYDYTGTDDIKYISKLDNKIWEYLEIRTGKKLSERLTSAMVSHCKKHELTDKISKKWDFNLSDLDKNIEGLALYVTEGIIESIN